MFDYDVDVNTGSGSGRRSGMTRIRTLLALPELAEMRHASAS